MDYVMITKFNECELYIKRLKLQNQYAKDNIRSCFKGELLDEYLETFENTDLYIKKLEKELQELRKCLTLLE